MDSLFEQKLWEGWLKEWFWHVGCRWTSTDCRVEQF